MQEDSERLLQETGEALDAQLSLAGVQDIRAMLAVVDEGRSLHPLHLTAVASTLLAAKAVEEQIQPQCGPPSRSLISHFRHQLVCAILVQLHRRLGSGGSVLPLCMPHSAGVGNSFMRMAPGRGDEDG